MEVIVVLALGIMVVIPIGYGLADAQYSGRLNRFILLLFSSTIGLAGLISFSFIGLTKEEKHQPSKYELIQEPVYRKIE